MSICSDTLVTIPRLGLTFTASDSGYPDFDGAVCAQTDPDIWFYSARPLESELPIHPYLIEGSGLVSPYETTFRTLAEICASCPVLEKCFNYALHHEYHGFWGGTSANDRDILREQHGIGVDDPYDGDAIDDAIITIRVLNSIEELGLDEY